MSKIPPHFREALGAACQRAAPLSNRVCHFYRFLEDSLSGAEHFVQRLLKMRRRARELRAYLHNILIVALLDLLTKQLLQRPVLKTFGVLGGIVRHHVRNERASEAFGAKAGIAREERVDRSALARRRNAVRR